MGPKANCHSLNRFDYVRDKRNQKDLATFSIAGLVKMVRDAMSKESQKTPVASPSRKTLRHVSAITSSHDRRRTMPIQPIVNALIAAGYSSLDNQARALGLNRSTAWTIIKNKHKLGRLNVKTTQRILENPDTPPDVRAVIEQYMSQNLVTLPGPHEDPPGQPTNAINCTTVQGRFSQRV
jgi:hypothetical protein